MTDGENQRLGVYVETSAGGERVRGFDLMVLGDPDDHEKLKRPRR